VKFLQYLSRIQIRTIKKPYFVSRQQKKISFIKKGFISEKQDLLEKKSEEKSLLRKKGFT
jgi:hypothetical protein